MKAADLFCGAGGAGLGLEAAGYDVTGYDHWRHALDTHRINGKQAVARELLDEPPITDRSVDLLWASPPCQPFSQAHRGKGSADERDGFPATIAQIAHMRPRLVIIENVKAIAGEQHREYLDSQTAQIERLGYWVQWRVLDCSRHGVPQSRKRLFIVARLDQFPEWPPEQPPISLHDALAVFRTPAELAELPSWASSRPAPTIVGSFSPHVLAEPRYRGAGDVSRQDDPNSVVVTEQEAAAIQGFPPDYRFADPKTARWLQIGNAVPPPVASALADINKET